METKGSASASEFKTQHCFLKPSKTDWQATVTNPYQWINACNQWFEKFVVMLTSAINSISTIIFNRYTDWYYYFVKTLSKVSLSITMTWKEIDSCSTGYTLAFLPPTRTGLKRMNSVSLLAKYKDMLCKVLGSLLFITRYVAITISLIFAGKKRKKKGKKY